jgi:hypothetical integral membrane protein (TIGR02206 family)
MSIERFWNHELNPQLAMQPFTWQHGVLILLGVLSVFFTLKYAHNLKNSRYENRVKKSFAFWLLILEIIYHLHYWSYGMFSVPLHVCSFGVMFSIVILFTDSKKVFEYLFFIGILGGLLALLIPNSLGYTYYNMRYYHFILLHMSIAIVPIYYYKAYNYRITLKSIYKTMGLLLMILPLVVYVNITFDKNYMFIGEKPQILENILPDWPYYLIVFVIGVYVTFHLLYFVSNYGILHLVRKLKFWNGSH